MIDYWRRELDDGGHVRYYVMGVASPHALCDVQPWFTLRSNSLAVCKSLFQNIELDQYGRLMPFARLGNGELPHCLQVWLTPPPNEKQKASGLKSQGPESYFAWGESANALVFL
jgi:hypothetical protein